MSKRSKARRDDLIRSMEGLSVLKAQESKPATPYNPKPSKPLVGYIVLLIASTIVAAIGYWLFHH